MQGKTRTLLTAIAITTLGAPAATADTLPQRESAFTPAQAVGDQYTSPPAPTGPSEVAPATTRPQDVAGVEEEEQPAGGGVGAGGDGGQPVGGAGPALVETGATAPSRRGGSLPFTGSDLLALVWIALALVAAGTVIEVARRRYEALRGRAGA